MPLKNYTTKIPPAQTIGEIQQILAEAGARGVNIAYDRVGEPEAVEFVIEIRDRFVSFRLPADWKKVQEVLKRDGVRPGYRTDEHAQRVAWRIVKDWIDSQMAFLESEQVDMPQLFLPYAVSPQSGRTLYEEFRDDRLLESGD